MAWTRRQVQVIGVARDVKFGNIKKPAGYIDYIPYTPARMGLRQL